MRLADDHMTVRLLLKRTGEAMTESRSSLSPSTVRAEAQQVRLDGTLWNARDPRRVRGGVVQMPKSQALLPAHRSPMIGGHDDLYDFDPPRLSDGDATADVIPPVVEISPPEAVKRRTVRGYGMVADCPIYQPGRNPTSLSRVPRVLQNWLPLRTIKAWICENDKCQSRTVSYQCILSWLRSPRWHRYRQQA